MKIMSMKREKLNIYVNENLTTEERRRRKIYIEKVKEARKQGKKNSNKKKFHFKKLLTTIEMRVIRAIHGKSLER